MWSATNAFWKQSFDLEEEFGCELFSGGLRGYSIQDCHLQRQSCESEARMNVFAMYKDAHGYWRWRLVGANNRLLADSGEGYENEADCLAAINLVRGSSQVPVEKR